jgi:phage shock protein PspC (stress-responsive transcriptional regulator)
MRSPADRVIAGVCGGLATYLGLDSTLVRLFFVLLVLGGGSGVLIYLVLWLIMPEAAPGTPPPAETGELPSPLDVAVPPPRPTGKEHRSMLLWIGTGLILIGLANLGAMVPMYRVPGITPGVVWPLLLILAGAALLLRRMGGGVR